MARMNREALFETLGKKVNQATPLVQGLPEAFAFPVGKKPLYYEDNNGEVVKLKGKSTIVNLSNGRAYGAVSDKYCPISNAEALGSVGYMKEMTVRKYGETASGKQWLIGELPEKKILGDTFKPYLVFRNSFDGAAPVQMAMAPLRVVCKNQITYAMRHSNYSYSLKHTKNAGDQIAEAHKMINTAVNFMDALSQEAEMFALKKISEADKERILDEMFPITDNMSELCAERMEAKRVALVEALNEPDLNNFRGSAWALINAYSDVITHYRPLRTTATAQENTFMTVTFNPKLMTALVSMLASV